MDTFIRLILKDNYNQDSFGPLAWNENWDFYNIIQGDDNTPFQKIWLTSDQQTAIYYTEDNFIHEQYFIITGKDKEKVASIIKQNTVTYTDQEIQKKFESAQNKDDFIKSITLIALAALPDKIDPQWFHNFETAFSHPEPEVRKTAILASIYTGWQSLLPFIEKIAASDSSLSLRQHAQKAIKIFKKHFTDSPSSPYPNIPL